MQSLIFAAGLTLACSASAQTSSNKALALLGIEVVEPMSAGELVRVKSRVASELNRSGSTAFFEDISDATGGKARHRPSGLVCPLGLKGQRILLASTGSASCETTKDSTVFRTRVELAPEGATVQWAAGAAQASAQREPGFKPYQGLSVEGRPKAGSNRPEHRTLHYSSRASGRERSVRVQVGLVRGWVLTERRESREKAQPSSMAELISEATFGLQMGPN